MSYPVEVKVVAQMRGEGSKATLPDQPDPNTYLSAFAAMEIPPRLAGCLGYSGSETVKDATPATVLAKAREIATKFPADIDVGTEELELRAHIIREYEWKKPGGTWGYSFPLREKDATLDRWVPLERPMIVRRTSNQGKAIEARILVRFFLQIQQQ